MKNQKSSQWWRIAAVLFLGIVAVLSMVHYALAVDLFCSTLFPDLCRNGGCGGDETWRAEDCVIACRKMGWGIKCASKAS